jgi:hypothetical protein
MFNVVKNALDAMPHGGTLRLRIRGRKDWVTDRNGVLITVGDSHVLIKYGGRILVKSNGTAARSESVVAMFLPI